MSTLLWVPSSEAGSLYPALPIALELARRGHSVTAMCEAPAEATFTSLGFPFRPATAMWDFVTGAPRAADREARLARHRGYMSALFEDARRAITSGRFDALLVDPLEPGPLFAAELAGLPAVSYVHWGLDEVGTDVPFQHHFWDRVTPAEEAFAAWWNEERRAVGLGPDSRPLAESRWYRCSPTLTLLLGLPELVHPRAELPPAVVRVGPTTWEPKTTGQARPRLGRLGLDRPAILASLSTIGQKDRELVEMIGEAVRDLDVDVVVTTDGLDGLTVPPNVRLLPFTPHDALMRRVALVICQAGNGTVNRAAAAGVPMLVVPDGRDRFVVARGAEAAGVARSIPRPDASATAIKEATVALLEDDQYRRAAAAIRTAARRYHGPTRAADGIEGLLRSEAKLTLGPSDIR